MINGTEWARMQIERLSPKPGDVIVVRIPPEYFESIALVQAAIAPAIPDGVTATIVSNACAVEVPGEAEQLLLAIFEYADYRRCADDCDCPWKAARAYLAERGLLPVTEKGPR